MHPADGHWPRHRLLRIAPAAWAALLAARPELAGEPLLEGWAQRGWPLIVRRRLPGEGAGVPAGLPLPPSAGKRRVALQLQPEDIVAVAALPRLGDVAASAPRDWQPTLQALQQLDHRFGLQARVFGSLAWQWLTGLAYLGPHSDIDLVWTLPREAELDEFVAALAGIDAVAPMRIDGELLRGDGSGVNWRELHARSAELLVKTAGEPLLCARDEFLKAFA